MTTLESERGEDERQEIIIVTGMSGAGRSTALKAFEDLGWFVVDNLPPEMIRPLLEVASKARDSLPRVAVSVDVRGGRLIDRFREFIEELRGSADVRVLFLDATDQSLVRRFEQVRRPHPLQQQGTLLEGIQRERDRLHDIRESCDMVMDTSELNVHQLAHRINERFSEPEDSRISVTVMSFGFKYGAPSDADLIVDMRFLPNPYWVPELRGANGRDQRVADYVLSQDGASAFLDAYTAALDPVLKGYERENKRHVTLAVGCTGGKHRSVAMTEQLASMLRNREDVSINIRHRDLGRE